MPTIEENTQYLYLILTNGDAPVIDWDAVAAAMELNKGAVTKRRARLKQAMDKGETPSGSVYTFLWLCVKHSKRDKVHDWKDIAEKCGTTSGAASKRYSRMKQAFEAGTAPPSSPGGSPVKKTPSKSTPKKKIGAAPADDDATPTPKRKRASPKKTAPIEEKDDDEEIKLEMDNEDIHESPTKKPKVIKPKTTKSKTNTTCAAVPTSTNEPETLIKNEDNVEDLLEAGDEVSCSAPDCAACECHAKEIANVLMTRSQQLESGDREMVEEMVGLVDLTE